ncbi:hypothetical protein EV652_104370 [Kribbella steppae]|uniref:MYXO-CTERM domain-containing protein n=1 Tax=Kribbella steppae TaxID=2512223 RepID=A0A4R2HNN8_9ACTN|nr:hypothetical protein [Kribbella steppae]TCO32764.1 hypothetical protein EV652_104370 [Kribbella steppae]
MNRKYSTLALVAVAMGAVAFTTTEASAKTDPGTPGSTSQTAPPVSTWPEEGSGYPGAGTWRSEYNYPNFDPKYEVVPAQAAAVSQSRSDDNGVEALQSGASALGGAALAFSGLWLYRRRQLANG